MKPAPVFVDGIFEATTGGVSKCSDGATVVTLEVRLELLLSLEIVRCNASLCLASRASNVADHGR